ncbi:MAG: NRDE family protein [Candidatus Eremiobacteraeota bacterium]|nr:NRDE family protein [Candidatus Eremiobacteraeota bacterium]
MCTVLLLLRPGDPWPLRIGANRDERLDRAFEPPGRHWPEQPGIVAGRDVAGGGSWFGVNDDGVVATIVNGMDRLGPLPGKASRGGLVLRALRERSARAAADAIASLDAREYRGFTLLIADRTGAFALGSDEQTIRVDALAPGHHMVTPDGVDVPTSPRFALHFDAFRAAPPPDLARGDWDAWTDLLRHADEDDPHRAMTVAVPEHRFGAVCSTLLALPAAADASPVLLFANGPPTRAPYRRIAVPQIPRAEIDR